MSNNLLQQIGTGVGRQAILSSPLGIATSTRVNFPDAGINVTQVGHGLIDKDQIAQLFVSARSGSHNAVAGVFGREELDFVGWITEWTGWNTTLWAGKSTGAVLHVRRPRLRRVRIGGLATPSNVQQTAGLHHLPNGTGPHGLPHGSPPIIRRRAG